MGNSYNETYHQSFESTNWKNDDFNDDQNLINQYLELHRRDLSPEDIKEIASELDRQKSAEYLKLLSEKNDITLDDKLQIKTLKRALNIPNSYNSEDLNENIEVYLDFNFEEARAAIAAHGVAWSSFPPNPPPRRRTSTSTLFEGIPRIFATPLCTYAFPWVDAYTLKVPCSPGMT